MFKILLNDRDKAIQQRDSLLETYFTKVIPAIEKSTQVLQDRQVLDKELISVTKESTDAVKENTKLLHEIRLALALRGNAQTGST
jgi:hypothetical protein